MSHVTEVTGEGRRGWGNEEASRPPSAPIQGLTADPEPGDVLAGYQLLETIGQGGASTVFRALRIQDGGIYALKVLSSTKVRRPRMVQRFVDEIRAASSVRHPGLVEVFDFVEEQSPRRLAYAMEYVPGEVLRARIRREGILDLRTSIQIGIQVCDALSALHGRGIIHRDLKPENILLGETPMGVPPRVKLFDFGVVKFLPGEGRVPQEAQDRPGTFVGTPRYMAPEQAAGLKIDHRADLFALGVMMFEMITGRCPHDGDALRDVVMAKLKGAPRITVSAAQELLPLELTDVVDGCLQLKPHARPKSALEVRKALQEAECVLFTVGAMRAMPGGGAMRVPRETGPVAPSAETPRNAEEPELDPWACEIGSPPSPTWSPSLLRMALLVLVAIGLGWTARWAFRGHAVVVLAPSPASFQENPSPPDSSGSPKIVQPSSRSPAHLSHSEKSRDHLEEPEGGMSRVRSDD